MLTAMERREILKILAAYAPIRNRIQDKPRVHVNAPQPRTARLKRIPWRERINAVKEIHEMVLRELANGKA